MVRAARDIRDIAGESILLAGGGRAILLQIADPGVGLGVARHSDFVKRPLDRLHGTMTYLYTIVFGSPDELRFVKGLVDRAHGPVHSDRHAAPVPDAESSPDAAPVRYDAFDHGLQLWVAATLYETATRLYEDVYGRLSDTVADRVYAEYAVVGTALQMPPELWPADRAAFRDYWNSRMRALHVTDEAREVCRQLLYPVSGPLVVRAAMPWVRLMTTGMLPPALRDAYRLPWDAGRQANYDRWMRVLGAVVPRLPPRIRRVLRDRYLSRLRRRMWGAARSSE